MTQQRIVPAHGALQRPGAKPVLRLLELPPWHGWTYRSEATRAKRWIESLIVVPTGYGAGSLMRLAKFQTDLLRTIYDALATFVSMPAANGKTTFLAAVALERICRGDDFAEVDVVATKEDQAAILVETAKRMVECAPDLVPLVAWHSKEGILEYRPTGSRLQAHPAKLSALQGLNFTTAIVDEVGFASDDVVESLLARLAKRPDARLVGIGTPGFDPNVLQRIRSAADSGELPAGVRYVQFAAPAGCSVADREAWKTANPALAAGFMSETALAVQADMLPERAFRTYHLGQWTDTATGWLPPGAWESCPVVDPPPVGADVVVAVDGTHRRTLAVCVSTLSGEVSFVWAAEAATDGELREVLDMAADRWNVIELIHPRRIRPALFADLAVDFPVRPWSPTPDVESTSAGELYRAIVDGRLAHDGDPTLADHVAALRVRWGIDGSLRLTRPDDGWSDAATAMRAAWWRAGELAADGVGSEPLRIY